MQSGNNISVEGVGLTFPNGFVGLKETNLDVSAGSFCTLLGPSGSGKTTLLRAIAGLTNPSSGRILIGGKDVTSLPVQARNIGFVFQNYALFPHMTVAENIAYPLKLHKWDRVAREARVEEVLSLIELPHVAARAVGELSGGQQQRVAIGRALAYNPSLLLLDEPMGALDRRLRQQLGAQLREIQQRTGITAVYVTHDQEEAFILSDRIAIMEKGEILQYAAPADLYFRPNSRFVAEFLGEANIIEVDSIHEVPDAELGAQTALGVLPAVDGRSQNWKGGALSLVLRPEAIRLSDRNETRAGHTAAIPVRILHELFLGSRCLVTAEGPSQQKLLIECAKADISSTDGQLWASWPRESAILVNH